MTVYGYNDFDFTVITALNYY